MTARGAVVEGKTAALQAFAYAQPMPKGPAMADRIVEESAEEIPEIPELVEKVILFALDEGKEKIEKGEDLVPFTTLVVKNNLFIESHPGDTPEDCFVAARHTVEGARGAGAYAFCYDGYVEIDDDTRDAIIAEGGLPGEDTGYAIGYLYTMDDDGKVVFESDPAYIGEAPNYMGGLKEAEEYGDDEIDERYLEEDEEEGAEEAEGTEE